MSLNQFGTLLEKALKIRQMQKKELASRAKITQTNLSKITNSTSKREATYSEIMKIIKALSMDAADFFTLGECHPKKYSPYPVIRNESLTRPVYGGEGSLIGVFTIVFFENFKVTNLSDFLLKDVIYVATVNKGTMKIGKHKFKESDICVYSTKWKIENNMDIQAGSNITWVVFGPNGLDGEITVDDVVNVSGKSLEKKQIISPVIK